MNNYEGGYPPGAANDKRAPYNQEENPDISIDVTITMTLSKTVTIHTNNYIKTPERDEDNSVFFSIDYSDSNFKEDVENQVKLPSDSFPD